MSLSTQVSSLATRIGTEIKSLWTAVNAKAPLASPTFTGTPSAPNASVNTNTTQVATTAFVVGQAGTSTPLIEGTAAAGTSLRYAREDHVHPSSGGGGSVAVDDDGLIIAQQVFG